jgi:hypothetical protein
LRPWQLRHQTNSITSWEEFNLFLFSFLVIGLVALAVLCVIGIIVGVFVVVTGGAAVVSGAALSSSIAAAVRRNPQTGLMWFVIQLSIAGGTVSGFAVGRGLLILSQKWLSGTGSIQDWPL